MSGFASAKCNIARHEITVWIPQYGRNQAPHRVNIALLDSNSSHVALGSLKSFCDLIANDKWLHSEPERGDRSQGTLQRGKPGLWCNVSQKQQGEV